MKKNGRRKMAIFFMNEINPVEPNLPPKQNPSNPGEGQNAQPGTTEINPSRPGSNTEVDLDKAKIKTYPDKTPPERH